MPLTVVPILQDLRNLYYIPDRMDRFHAYVALLSGKTRGEPLPIGNFSPMGQRQAEYLECLLNLAAEAEAAVAARDAVTRLPGLSLEALEPRVMLVVIDEPRNGWTQRSLTDSDWRFRAASDAIPTSKQGHGFRPWVTVQLWTDVEPSGNYVRQETLGALYRYLHKAKFGNGDSLREMMAQEGRALSFAGIKPNLAPDELEAASATIEQYLNSREYPICFSALYGDETARTVGYEPLGLPKNAGFDVAISQAITAGPPEGFVVMP